MNARLQEMVEQEPSLGDLIATLYEHYQEQFPGDDDLAALATAEAVNRILQSQKGGGGELLD